MSNPIQLPAAVKCCVCGRVFTSVNPITPGQEIHEHSAIGCHCGAVLVLCGPPEDLHTHQIMVKTPDGPRPLTKAEALARGPAFSKTTAMN